LFKSCNADWKQFSSQALAEQFSVYAPSHPGFGHTPGLAWIATIADMALFYLWFLDAVGLARTHLVGHDIGGWLAADMATACPHVVERLVLVDASGKVVSDSYTGSEYVGPQKVLADLDAIFAPGGASHVAQRR
jgi:pimeloyl-ACP methyl ester carboxylesterase